MIAYGLALGLDALVQLGASPAAARAQRFAAALPALLWSGVLLHLLRDEGARERLVRLWTRVLLPLGLAVLLLGSLALFDPAAGALRPAAAWALVVAVLLPLLLAALRLGGELRGAPRRDLALGLLLIALLFTLGAGLLLLPLAPLPRTLLLLAVAVDLEVLGLIVAAFDALELGQVFARDALRSLLAASLAALLLGGQVAMAMVLATGLTAPMLALLLLVVASTLSGVVFAPRLQGALDTLAFPGDPGLRRERALLRGVADAAPRRATSPAASAHPLFADEAAFVRHTRHALRHHGDLARLADSPLTDLPAVRARLGAEGGTLERAQALKLLLEASVAKLKPPGPEPFGTTDAWRHYNALHFPYLVGIRPFSQRPHHADLDPVAEEALDWFRTHVPERTFYNWQRAATELVARDLMEGSRERTPERA